MTPLPKSLLLLTFLVVLLCLHESNASKRDNTVNFSQAVVQISGTGNSASQNSNTQSSSSQSSSSQANSGIQNGNTQNPGGQSYTSPAASASPALGVCPANQGWPRSPGSCDSGYVPLVPSSAASDPKCPSGTASCQMTGHPGFCCPFSSWCCIDLIHQAACCPVGTCCEGVVQYGSAGPPGGSIIWSNVNSQNNAGNGRLRVPLMGMTWVTLLFIHSTAGWEKTIPV